MLNYSYHCLSFFGKFVEGYIFVHARIEEPIHNKSADILEISRYSFHNINNYIARGWGWGWVGVGVGVAVGGGVGRS